MVNTEHKLVNTKSSILSQRIRKDKALYFLLIPGLLYYIIFHYLPMGGVIIAFQKFHISRGILGSRWIGLDNFRAFFKSPDAFVLIRNTLLINIYELLYSFPVPIILSLLLNELKRLKFKRMVQTISYLPHFISTVIVVGMVVNFLSPQSGIINILLTKLGLESIFFMSKPEYFRTIYIASGIWQSAGWGTILYLAAISGIDPTLYEAAVIDGSNRFQKVIYITIPGMANVIVTLLILNIGKMLSVGAQKIILMYNPLVYETADVISTYVYRRGLIGTDYSFATAVGLFESIINLVLIVSANKLSKKYSETSLW